MLILRDQSVIPDNCKHAVIALGNFDGVHLGHMAVIRQTLHLAKAQGNPAGILTFEPHPRRVFTPELPSLRILSFYEKANLLKAMGIDFIRVIRFTRKFALTSADIFIEKLLCEQLAVAHVATGDDFVFGHERAGTTDYLAQQAKLKGFGYTKCPAVMVGGQRCSSTRIRHLLAFGKMEEVAALLGRPYRIAAIVRAGDRRGRELGFPTANLLPYSIFMPAFGVYAVKVTLGKRSFSGVANLGIRPTFSSKRVQLEIHIFDFNETIYGQHLEVDFMHYIRMEEKFSDLEALKMQITKDSEKVRKLLHVPV